MHEEKISILEADNTATSSEGTPTTSARYFVIVKPC
jgi:hypothetical protein